MPERIVLRRSPVSSATRAILPTPYCICCSSRPEPMSLLIDDRLQGGVILGNDLDVGMGRAAGRLQNYHQRLGFTTYHTKPGSRLSIPSKDSSEAPPPTNCRVQEWCLVKRLRGVENRAVPRARNRKAVGGPLGPNTQCQL
jgi:hypothetical protein